MKIFHALKVSLTCLFVLMANLTAHAAVWDQFNYAPASRVVNPVSVFKTNGNIINPNNVLAGQGTAIVGAGAYITLDFGKEVGGIATLNFSASSDANQSVGIAFSESSLYVGVDSDRSNGSANPDGALTASVTGASSYTVPSKYLRGGFRYLTIFLRSGGWVHLSGVSLNLSIDPERATPNQYPNYFYSNDNTLNRAWYAGAYTFQTNIVRNNQGRAWPPASVLWDNGNVVGELGNVVLTDAAKRDRTVWPGDMGVSLPTGYASLFETISSRNSLQTLYNHQNGSGELPFAGPPMNFGGSDTYHMWTLYGTYLYYLYTGDKGWLDGVWNKYKSGMNFIQAKVGSDGLLNVTGTNDWARDNPGGETVEANSMLYGVLTSGAYLAHAEGDTNLENNYNTAAANLKNRINSLLWDTAVGAYRDTPSRAFYPQDGNSLAVWMGVTDSAAKAKSISYALNENWNDKGSRSPEFTLGTGTARISTFASSLELFSHFESGYDRRGLDMIRTMWGYMLNSPQGTGSTYWEGFNSDGSPAYQDSFQSMSHGWGTGPTSALTFYVLGIKPNSAAGQTFQVIPHPGNLTHVEGNLTMAQGQTVFVNYDAGANCNSFSMRVDSQTHSGVARIGIPRFGSNHTIAINGTTAWDGNNFLGSLNVGGANQDADYIYFTGVQPGARTFSFSDNKGCPAPAENWAFCSDENGSCSFSGTKRVRYGKQGKYRYGIFNGSVGCNSGTFGGDPISGTSKSCQISNDLFTDCAGENQTCSFSGTKEVRFGANGQWTSRVANGSIACNTATFGDPLPNTIKRCEYRDPISSPSSSSPASSSSTTSSIQSSAIQNSSVKSSTKSSIPNSSSVGSSTRSSSSAVSSVASSVSGGACSGVAQYVDKSTYATGSLVQNIGNQYRCAVGGWCTIGGPYEPGVGWAWQNAWTLVGSCN